MAIIQDADNYRARANKSFQMIRGRSMGDGEFEPWIGKDFLSLVEALEDNPEADAQVDFANWGRTAKNDNWQGQITDLQTKLGDEQLKDAGLATNLADTNAKLDTANKTITDDETKMADLSTQLSTLKAQADKPEPTNPTVQAPLITPPVKQTFMNWLVSVFKVQK
ncbi:hypothetical protein [Cryobacterium sp. GrIS_2_6]|uniref:hypothetical protein n=1 Tax=Cryobacterium sp. GrIS_2_6 TaxID=3162785 RepID=UPI002DFAE0BB|nr:hypothetical protein [Cryobacterium psychrotolerans]